VKDSSIVFLQTLCFTIARGKMDSWLDEGHTGMLKITGTVLHGLSLLSLQMRIFYFTFSGYLFCVEIHTRAIIKYKPTKK
jgi:hypothetical protein